MAKRMSREEKTAQAQQQQREREVGEIKQRAARARSLRTYSEKAAWTEMSEGVDGNRQAAAGTLWELVRMFDSANDDLRKRIASLADEMANALRRFDDGRRYVFGGSYAIGNNGAEIERLDAKRQALADAVAMTARASGWWVPQVYDGHARARHARLSTVDVAARADGLFYIMCEGKPLTGYMGGPKVDDADTRQPEPLQYESEDSAWLAAAAYIGRD